MQEITDENGFTLFNHDLDTGRTIWTKVEDGKQVFRIDTPVDKILDANQQHYNDSDGKRFGDWQRVASVPLNLAYSNGFTDAVQQQDDKWISKFLNDGDNRKFRTFKGNI